jgi:hypothetical protein
MTSGALAFMLIAWGTIIGSAVIFLNAIVKHSKQ